MRLEMKMRDAASAIVLIILLISCSNYNKKRGISDSAILSGRNNSDIALRTGNAYLYGEKHANQGILEKEFELWNEYYRKGMRHLFLELPYYTAEYLNIWIKEDNDTILEAIYDDWGGSPSQNPYTIALLKNIKKYCPETIFHGTDVGHQYESTGKRFKNYLEDTGQMETRQYLLTKEAIGQGIYYSHGIQDIYRENTMTQNFVREFDLLNGVDIMGIYGLAHTGLNSLDYSQTVPCMANQLAQRYGDRIKSTDLSEYSKTNVPSRIDKIIVDGIEYNASYYGTQKLNGFNGVDYREFWRLENAYASLKSREKNHDYLPYDYYPMRIKAGQVFVIDYHLLNGTTERMYYVSEDDVFEGENITRGISIE
jgi:hypothetical protein